MRSFTLFIEWVGAMAVGMAGAVGGAGHAESRLEASFFVLCHNTQEAKGF